MAGGQRRLESQYAEHEGKYLMVLVFSSMLLLGLVLLLFKVFGSARQEEYNKAHDDLVAIGQGANDYREEYGAFPESFTDLQAFAEGNAVTEEEAFPEKDPWKREYRYFRVSDDRAAVVSGGRNRKIETSLDNLSAISSDTASETRDEIRFIHGPEEDDWIYLAGAWRTAKEEAINP